VAAEKKTDAASSREKARRMAGFFIIASGSLVAGIGFEPMTFRL
jgi:hypothetical protein